MDYSTIFKKVQTRESQGEIVVGDCLEVMGRMPDGCVDLVVTSPPYDNLRDYAGYTFEFELMATKLFRVTKQGGVVVWVVGDATIKGSETGTSLRQALGFIGLGFRLHDTMIYQKINYMPLTHNRYEQAWEYMFVFSKGRPTTFNPIKIPCTHAGKVISRNSRYANHAVRGRKFVQRVSPTKYRNNVWPYKVGTGSSTNDKNAFAHPAIFPEALAHDHILSWSNEGNLVFDPFIGSGTTAVAADRLGRNFFGCDINPSYVRMALERLRRDRESRAQLELL